MKESLIMDKHNNDRNFIRNFDLFKITKGTEADLRRYAQGLLNTAMKSAEKMLGVTKGEFCYE